MVTLFAAQKLGVDFIQVFKPFANPVLMLL